MNPESSYPKTSFRFRRLVALSTLAFASALPAIGAYGFNPDSRDRLTNLAHQHWRFTVGDDARWSDPNFDDKSWSRVSVREPWEAEGYDNYNGYAWYRCRFTYSEKSSQATYLVLGRIDDADEVFVNGKRVGGMGQFPPRYASAWNQERVYLLPAGTWRPGETNVIAVRVFDAGGDGGIVEGPVGIYSTDLPVPALDLAGIWQFQAGDNPAWKEDGEPDGFKQVSLPGYWENAGHGELDGFAWYRRTFAFQPQPGAGTMVLMLGKIDDTDEVYLNGTKIGGTGALDDSDRHGGVDYYDQQRGYYFPASLLKEQNVLAVRVHDHGGMGGIYEGPLGIISQENYIEYWQSVRHRRPGLRSLMSLFRKLDRD